VSGVTLPETAQVAGRTLVLNGAGVRRRLLFEVYVGALYLETHCDDAAAILQADAPWKVTLHFLRDVDHEKILDAFRKAFDANSPREAEHLHAQLRRFHDEAMSELVVRRGQEVTLAYVPGEGSTLLVPGGGSSRVEGAAFGHALLRSWLGEHPSDRALREAMLGRKPAAPPGGRASRER
jgi:hypothetical protein